MGIMKYFKSFWRHLLIVCTFSVGLPICPFTSAFWLKTRFSPEFLSPKPNVNFYDVAATLPLISRTKRSCLTIDSAIFQYGHPTLHVRKINYLTL